MSLREYTNLVQGSDEWLEARRGLVTASVVGKLITTKTIKPANNDVSRALTAQLVAERITGFIEPTYVSDDMMRGIEDEPIARNLYAERYAPVVEVGFLVLEDDDIAIGYSPDGLVGDDGLIEIKSRRAKTHLQTILSDEVPAANMAQLQCGLLVTGREWIDYVSYCGGMPLWVKRVFPDPRWFEAILAAVKQFEQAAVDMQTAYIGAVKGLLETKRVVELEMRF